MRFSLLRVRSPLLTEYLFLWVLRCFTSPRSHHLPYTFRQRQLDTTPARFPHSDTLESTSVCRLPEAYRRLPRPSSAPDAKASTDCSYKLTQHKKSNTKTLKINQRCSRPLYSSQTTTNPNPSNNQTVATQIGPAQKKPHTGASSEPQQRAPPPHPQTLNASASPVTGKFLLTFQPKQPIHTNSEHRLP